MTEEPTVAIGFVRTKTLQKLLLTWKCLMTCRQVRALKDRTQENIFIAWLFYFVAHLNELSNASRL